jgi:hypothetical protein
MPSVLDVIVMIRKLEFNRVLAVAKLDSKKEGMQRKQITLHSFRRLVKTVTSNQINQDYSEGFLGHKKSSYYTLKEPEKRQIYATKCMKYLTFLDYTTLVNAGKSIEKQLSEKDLRIKNLEEQLKHVPESQDLKERMNSMKEQVDQLGFMASFFHRKNVQNIIEKGSFKEIVAEIKKEKAKGD